MRRLATLVALCCFAAVAAMAEERPPNIVLLIGDDIGYPYLGFMGDDNVVTPASDTLAAGGVWFSHGHVTAPYCRPSLRTLITGLHPVQYAMRLDALMEDVKREASYDAMDPDRQARWLVQARAAGMARFDTLPKLLRERGYVSWQGGKWWEGGHENGHFDEGMTQPWDMSTFGTDGFFLQNMGNEGNRLVRETMAPLFEFIERNREDPMFIWFGPQLPHTPFDAPFKYRKSTTPTSPGGTTAWTGWWTSCKPRASTSRRCSSTSATTAGSRMRRWNTSSRIRRRAMTRCSPPAA